MYPHTSLPHSSAAPLMLTETLSSAAYPTSHSRLPAFEQAGLIHDDDIRYLQASNIIKKAGQRSQSVAAQKHQYQWRKMH